MIVPFIIWSISWVVARTHADRFPSEIQFAPQRTNPICNVNPDYSIRKVWRVVGWSQPSSTSITAPMGNSGRKSIFLLGPSRGKVLPFGALRVHSFIGNGTRAVKFAALRSLTGWTEDNAAVTNTHWKQIRDMPCLLRWSVTTEEGLYSVWYLGSSGFWLE